MTIGDNALRALALLWHFDWRWIALSEPHIAADLPELADPFGRGDEGRLVRSHGNDDTRSACARVLQTWWKQEGRTGPSAPLVAALRQAPVRLWTSMLLDQTPGSLDNHVADVIADRLSRQKTVHIAESRSWELIESVYLAGLLFPKNQGITEALASWTQTSWRRNIAAMRAGLSGDDAGLDRWFAAAFSSQTLPPPWINREWTMADTSPWFNLGLIAHRPTPARLAALKAVLAGNLTSPLTVRLVSFLGGRNYGVSTELGIQLFLLRGDVHRSAMIPAQLALAGLADRRPLPALAIPVLHELSKWACRGGIDLTTCKDPRVCDYVAIRLLLRGDDFQQGWVPADVRSDSDFVAGEPTQPDDVVEKLRAAFAPLVKRFAVPTPVTGVNDFLYGQATLRQSLIAMQFFSNDGLIRFWLTAVQEFQWTIFYRSWHPTPAALMPHGLNETIGNHSNENQ